MWNMNRERDERSLAVEHRAGYVAFQAVNYLLLLDVVLHTWRPGITDQGLGLFDVGMPLDLWVILFAGGVVQWVIILRGRIVGRRRALLLAGVLAAGMVLSAAIAMLIARA